MAYTLRRHERCGAGGFQVAYTTDNGTRTTADLDYVDNDGTLVFSGTAGETEPLPY